MKMTLDLRGSNNQEMQITMYISIFIPIRVFIC